MELLSTLSCPLCGVAEELTMPVDACQFFHECVGCHTLLRPLAGHCCVFCSFGTVPCPPMQGDDDASAPASCCTPSPAQVPRNG
ncbi:MAG: GDCCVxC domain-containing (seleno)protein [Gemmatimonadaceae bacterium]|nr:GDCCVxC domain-containing (seleno)protein [Gemmatimonadaceae bacterium]